MRIVYHRQFLKQFSRLPQQQQKKVHATLADFIKNPFDVHLHNHGLHGAMGDKRSISVTDDLRVLFQEFDSYTVVILLKVGGHGKVYE